MKKYLVLSLCLVMLLSACSKEADTQPQERKEKKQVSVEEYDLTTEEEEVKQSENDRDMYAKAIAEGDISLCSEITFATLQMKCEKELSE